MQRTYHFSENTPTHARGHVFDKLVAAGKRQHFSSGAQVIHRGDPATGFWLIQNGHVMACRFGQEGERTLFAVLGPGDLIGELACLTGLTQQVNALAEGEVDLVWIDLSTLDRLLEGEPGFTRWLLSALAHKLRSALDRVEGSHNLPAETRIARVLADIAAIEGRELAMTQQEIADHVGVSRITVGKVLSKLRTEGLISLGYGKITVPDPVAIGSYSPS